jgi:sulfotransferase
MKFHCISGLPRSGSTLLAALLRQNPGFHAGIASPVVSLWNALLGQMSAKSEFGCFFDQQQRERILRGVVLDYYRALTSPKTIFDSNRTWTGKMALLHAVFPQSKVICCVRSLDKIVNSIERQLRANPEQPSRLFGFAPDSTIYGRVETMLDLKTGFIGAPWAMLREAWYGPYADRLLVIDYDDLTKFPEQAIGAIYNAVGETAFAHDFVQFNFDSPRFDEAAGMPGLHHVKGPVMANDHPDYLPPDISTELATKAFWREARS